MSETLRWRSRFWRSAGGHIHRRQWPIVAFINRCTKCRRPLFPWQDLVPNSEPNFYDHRSCWEKAE